MLLEFSNFSNFDRKLDFVQNLSDYTVYSQGLEKIGDKNKVLSNIDYMKNELSNLKATGRLSEEDFQHDILNRFIKDASEYLFIRDPDINAVLIHYSCCRDFRSLVDQITGGGK